MIKCIHSLDHQFLCVFIIIIIIIPELVGMVICSREVDIFTRLEG